MTQESLALEPCGTVRSHGDRVNSGLHWSFSSRDCSACSVSKRHKWEQKHDLLQQKYPSWNEIIFRQTSKISQNSDKCQTITHIGNINVLLWIQFHVCFLTIYRAQACRTLWFRKYSHPLKSQQSFACFLNGKYINMNIYEYIYIYITVKWFIAFNRIQKNCLLT